MTHVHVKKESLQTERSLSGEQKFCSNMAHTNHSMMAMEAAKQMRRSKQKRKTGRVVCHHLRMMLVTECVGDIPPFASRSGKPLVPGRLFPHSNRKHQVEDKQISLL